MTKKLLNLSEFGELLPEDQLDLLQKDGVYVGKRRAEEQSIVLFQLYSFYVEVYYRKYRKEIDRVITSNDINIVSPYLDQIEVRDLKNNKEK